MLTALSSVKLESLRCSRALTAKKYTEKCDARVMHVLVIKSIASFDVPVAVALVFAYTP